MELGKFKEYIESFPDGHEFDFTISNPFSWRGVYAEVAFDISETESTKEEILSKIDKAYKETFHGYKGGEYTYSDYTEIHFEEDGSSYTGGQYVSDWISKLEEGEPFYSQEERFVKLAFK